MSKSSINLAILVTVVLFSLHLSSCKQCSKDKDRHNPMHMIDTTNSGSVSASDLDSGSVPDADSGSVPNPDTCSVSDTDSCSASDPSSGSASASDSSLISAPNPDAPNPDSASNSISAAAAIAVIETELSEADRKMKMHVLKAVRAMDAAGMMAVKAQKANTLEEREAMWKCLREDVQNDANSALKEMHTLRCTLSDRVGTVLEHIAKVADIPKQVACVAVANINGRDENELLDRMRNHANTLRYFGDEDKARVIDENLKVYAQMKSAVDRANGFEEMIGIFSKAIEASTLKAKNAARSYKSMSNLEVMHMEAQESTELASKSQHMVFSVRLEQPAVILAHLRILMSAMNRTRKMADDAKLAAEPDAADIDELADDIVARDFGCVEWTINNLQPQLLKLVEFWNSI
jgi:hypothetical protein